MATGSQTHEDWIPVPDHYDDGGFSGGNMDRPALHRLMADIEAGRVDIVVVYKIDRLSRSLGYDVQHPGISEPEVVLPMRQLATMWPQLFPVEQCRLVQLLIGGFSAIHCRWTGAEKTDFGSFCRGITRSSTGQNSAWRGGFRQEKGLGDYPSP